MKPGADRLALPAWAVVTDRRREHIARVVALLDEWSKALGLDADTRAAWRDAGIWHDALRDAPAKSLHAPAADPTLPEGAWHGPAAAERLRAGGERREDVLSAIMWHTVGSPDWGATGRALYCADFLEPGRKFQMDERAVLAGRFASDPGGVLRDVVRMRIELALAKHTDIHARTVALWNVAR